MRGNSKLIFITGAVAVCSFLATVLEVPTLVMATFAFALLASVGYVWVEVILRGRAASLELVSMAVGLVLAAPVIGGIAMAAAGVPLYHLTWSIFFVGLTLVGDVVLIFRYRSQVQDNKGNHEHLLPIQYEDRSRKAGLDLRSWLEPARDSAMQSEQHPVAPLSKATSWRHISPWHVGACGLALLITVGAIWLSQTGAASQHYSGFTELWLTDHSYSASMDNLGIKNQEGVAENYRLVLLRRGHVSTAWEITLAAGQTWQRTVRVSTETRANLYLLPDLKQPYRYVDTGP
jgi:hypothetical protein